ncbi:MAG TPA: M14 family zinc carboxypeptidase, partial [Gemmataceae bacterium]|nr:M14 family zinc carboxypeptidase [Gemmataceae bacterium]
MKRNLFFCFAAVSLLLCLATMPEAAAQQGPKATQPSKATAALPGQFVHAIQGITTPKQHLGFNLGDDYCLANYQQLLSYWDKLEKESDRLTLVKMGVTEEGRPQMMGIVTSPANHKKLDFYKEIARRLARAEGVSAEEAARLAGEGKAVVWIDGGLHA